MVEAMMNRMDLQDEGATSTEPARPTRAEIETLCMLHAVGDGCCVEELAKRVGLTGDLACVVTEAIEPLFQSGWLVDLDGVLRVTDAGSQHLRSSLRTFGLV
jgi:hypothetical protein